MIPCLQSVSEPSSLAGSLSVNEKILFCSLRTLVSKVLLHKTILAIFFPWSSELSKEWQHPLNLHNLCCQPCSLEFNTSFSIHFSLDRSIFNFCWSIPSGFLFFLSLIFKPIISFFSSSWRICIFLQLSQWCCSLNKYTLCTRI